MATNEEILAQEWRAIILGKLDKLELGQTAIQKDLLNITSNYAPLSEVHELRQQIASLQSFKSKAIGIVIGVNAVVMVIGWIIQNWIVSHIH